MTTNMQDIIAEAFEAGRVAERELARIGSLASLAEISSQVIAQHTTPRSKGNGTRKVRAAKLSVTAPMASDGSGLPPPKAAKATKATKATKAKTIARGLRKEAGPREKGVKKGILNLIAGNTLTTAGIVATSGFKERSVLGTLAGLKKEGLISQDENKLWHPTDPRAKHEQSLQAMIS